MHLFITRCHDNFAKQLEAPLQKWMQVQHTDIETAVSSWNNILFNTAQNVFGLKKVSKNSKRWWNKEITQTIQQARRARRSWQRSRAPALRTEWKRLVHRYEKLMQEAKQKDLDDRLQVLQNSPDPKVFWKLFRSLTATIGDKAVIYELQHPDDSLLLDPVDKANLLNKTFSEAGNHGTHSSPQWEHHVDTFLSQLHNQDTSPDTSSSNHHTRERDPMELTPTPRPSPSPTPPDISPYNKPITKSEVQAALHKLSVWESCAQSLSKWHYA